MAAEPDKRRAGVFKEAVAREPESIEAHTVLGNFYLGQRNLPLAEQEFEAAAKIAPMDSGAQIKLADFLCSPA